MSSIDKDLDNVFSLLKESGSGIVNNVKTLSNQIEELENKISEETDASYSRIKNSISSLKELVDSTSSKIEHIKENEAKERSGLRVNYYQTLISLKNELMNFDIVNIDSLITSFDDYNNSKKPLFAQLDKIVRDQSMISRDSIFDAANIISGALDDYKNILEKHEELLSSSFSSIIRRISELTLMYVNAYSEYDDFEKKSKIEYLEKREKIESLFPNIKDIISLPGDELRNKLDNSYIQIIDELEEKYIEEQNKNYQDFKNESEDLINEIEKILSIQVFNDENAFRNRGAIIEKLKNDFRFNGVVSKDIIQKFENALDQEDLENAVTYCFKEMNNNTYNKYLEKEKELEKEFLYGTSYERNKELLLHLISKNYSDPTIIEIEIERIRHLEPLEKELASSIISRYRNLCNFSIKQEQIISCFNKVLIAYDYERKVIRDSFNNAIEDNLLNLKNKVRILSIQNSYQNKKSKFIYSEIMKSTLKGEALLKYEAKTDKLHRNFIQSKALVKIGSSLFDIEKEIDLLGPKYKLDKLVSEYNVYKSSFETLYNSEKELLDTTKNRITVRDTTNYAFTKSLLEHRTRVAIELLDLAKEEYQLRVNVLNEIKETSSGYSLRQISFITNTYLDEIKKMEQVKEVELNSVLQKIELFGEESAESKELNVSLVNDILSSYETASSSILDLIKNDPMISYHKEFMDNIDNAIIEGITEAQEIKNSSLERSISSLKIAEDQFNLIVESLGLDDTDYTKAYNSYLEIRDSEIYKLTEKLNTESAPLIQKIDEIKAQYTTDFYKNEYEKLNNEHQKLVNEYYQELIDTYEKIDLEHPKNVDNLDKLIELESQEINSSHDAYKESIETKVNSFLRNKEELQKELNGKLEIEDSKSKERERSISLESNEKEKEVLETIDEMKSIRDESIKSLTKLLRKERINYEFEFEAFNNDLNSKFNSIKKEIKTKYKNISVYKLSGKK